MFSTRALAKAADAQLSSAAVLPRVPSLPTRAQVIVGGARAAPLARPSRLPDGFPRACRTFTTNSVVARAATASVTWERPPLAEFGAGEADKLKFWKPRTPGQRHRVTITRKGLWKGKPYGPLTKGAKRISGRNNQGRITVWHRGGGSKRKLRLVDYKRKETADGFVERIEYDPNRTAYIALVRYPESPPAYILACQGLKQGQTIQAGVGADIKPGNALPMSNIPIGTSIHNIELRPGQGGKMARSAGTSCTLVKKGEDGYVLLRMKSGEQRLVLSTCMATIGQVSNLLHKNQKLGKAGASRWRGRRPTTRGVAMNPVDHPHGGGEGKAAGGRPSVTPWGKPTKGYRTRNNPRTEKFRFKRRGMR